MNNLCSSFLGIIEKWKLKHFLIANSFIFLLLAFLFPIRYETNDDVFLSLLANGIYTGTPENHLVFINALYGEVLKFLYTYIPIVEWYALLMAIFSILSASIIILFVKEKLCDGELKIVAIASLYILWAVIIQRFQFTTTASLTAIAGMLLLLEGKRLNGGLLFLYASLLRFESAGLIGILFVPLIYYIYGRRVKRYLGLFVLVLTCCVFQAINRMYYMQGGWSEFYEYNIWRARVSDNPNSFDFDKLPIGISKNDVLSAQGTCSDGNAIKADQLKLINSVLEGTDIRTKLRKTTQNSGFFKYYKEFLFLIILTVVLGKLLGRNQKNLKICILLNCIIAICLFGMISLSYIIKYRIVWGSILVMIIYGIHAMNYLPKAYMKHLVSAIFIVFTLFNGLSIVKQKRYYESNISLYEEHRSLLSKSNSKFILYPAKTFLLTYLISPFQMHTFFKPNQVIWKAWLNNYPLNSHSSRNDIVVDGDINMIMNRWYDLSVYNNTLLEHYGYIPDTTIIERTDNYYIVKFAKPKE